MIDIHVMIAEALATKVMGWRRVTPEGFSFSQWTDSEDNWIGFPEDFRPTKNITDAWAIAEKLGISLIPQTTEEGLQWYACDVEKVYYRGDEIAISVLNDTGCSAETAPMAICLAALCSIGTDIGELYE